MTKAVNSPVKCEHIKTNGTRCGSPALRNRKFCFFHHRMHDMRMLRRRRPNSPLDLPLLEDANAVQIAVQEVIAAVAEERLDPRRAGLMLYGLNTAACNLKSVEFEPAVLREIAGDESEKNPLAKLIEEILHLGDYADDAAESQNKLPPATETAEGANATAAA